MTETLLKNGSFLAHIPIGRKNDDILLSGLTCMQPKDFEQVDTVSYTVQMLTQHDYAEGWKQNIPRIKKWNKLHKDEKGTEYAKQHSNAYRMKVNLAQLPQYLWHRMQFVDDTYYSVRNGIHYYLIEKTNVDSEIRELVDITNKPYEHKFKERVYELLTLLKDNDVYGWVVIRAKSLYK
jgi:hypothetical protein